MTSEAAKHPLTAPRPADPAPHPQGGPAPAAEPRAQPEPAPGRRAPAALPPEITRSERRAYMVVVALLNLGFVAFDLQVPWPGRGFVLAGRVAVSAGILAAAVVAGWGLTPRTLRRAVRVMSVAVAVAFAAVVHGTGGYLGPNFPFFGTLAIVFFTIVPDDPVAAGMVGLTAMALGVGGALAGGAPAGTAAFWCLAFGSTTAYAYAGAALHVRMRRREAEAYRDSAALERERARQEEDRASLASRLEAIRDQVNDILLLVDERGAILQANDRALQAYGYSREEMARLDIRQLRAGHTVPDVDAQLRRAAEGAGVRFRTVHRRADGSTFPVEVSTRSVRVGGRRALQSIVRDLSEEQAARAALEYRAMLLDNLHEAVVGVDTSLVVTAWNPAAEQLFGWRRDEAIGRHVGDLLVSEYADGSTEEEVLARLARAGRVRLDVRRRGREGSGWIDVAATAVALWGPGRQLVGYMTVNRDVTQARRAQAALRAAQERLQRILETSSSGIWIVDTAGRTEFLNARAAELFGLSADDALGRLPAEVLAGHLREAALPDPAALLQEGQADRELRLRRPEGGPDRRVLFSRSVLRTADGRLDGAVGTFLDVTALRAAEEELHQAQKLESVGRLAAGIAHEINTPIQYIGLNAEFLRDAFVALARLAVRSRELASEAEAHRAELDALAEEVDLDYVVEQAPQAIERSLEGVHRVSAIVRAMKEFAHPGGAPAPADLNRALLATLEVARNEYKYVADVETDLGPLPPVTCVAGDLNQVFLNLLVNAAQAIEDVVKRDGGRGRIRIASRQDGDDVVITLADTGGGIPPEIAAQVFEPFFTTKPIGRGSGQGLAIARAIVGQHQGQITFESRPGDGTTFTIRLPIEPPAGGARRAGR